MTVYALDSNIVSYYLKGFERVVKNMEDCLMAGDEIVIAPIAYYEVKRGLALVASRKRMDKFDALCRMFPVGRFDNSILDIAVEIYTKQRKEGKIIEDADIFIAAFCLRHKFTLVTHNIKHFIDLTELKVADWTEYSTLYSNI